MNRHISDIHKCILYTYVWHTNNILFFSYKLMLKLIYAHKFVHLLWVFSFSFLSARSHSSFFLSNSIVNFYSFFVRIPSFKPTFRMSFFFVQQINSMIFCCCCFLYIYIHTHARTYTRLHYTFTSVFTHSCSFPFLLHPLQMHGFNTQQMSNQPTNEQKKKKKNGKKIL